MHDDRGALAPTAAHIHATGSLTRTTGAPTHTTGALARTSIAAHLTRGAIGFGLLGSAFALTPSVGPAALLLAVPGMVALRGCPTCWLVGLLQTVSAGRLQRTCGPTGCTLHPTGAAVARTEAEADQDDAVQHTSPARPPREPAEPL
jgi:hypothetical protein